jgi:hypothetical protein
MCIGGGSYQAPPPFKPYKIPPRRPPQQAPQRVDPSIIEKRREGITERRRRAGQRGSQRSRDLGPLETSSSDLR